jgi:predicted O-linked N-acetylglucosamine transferase (SPINDLY family)
MLGRARGQQGQYAEAERCCREALRREPGLAEAHLDLGNALQAMGRLDETIEVLRRALELKPDYLEAHYYLGNTLVSRGKSEEAVACYQRVIALMPDFAKAYTALGAALQSHGKLQEAIAAYRKALELAPDDVDTYNNLGYAYKFSGNLDDAEATMRTVLRLAPNLAGAHNNLGSVLESQGRVEEAIRCFRRTLELSPDFAYAHSNLLLALNYLPESTPESLLKEHLAWARAHERHASRTTTHGNDPDPLRRVRIGYVSPDLRNHPVAFFIEGILKHHSHEQYEIYCYAEVAKPDTVTERLRGYVPHWRNTCGLNDAQVLEQIRADKIDILVDLAGHTGSNRLTLFAVKPAPVQVTYLGYPNTTGLMSIDYRLTDRITDHEEDAGFYSEQLLYLEDGFCCYEPPSDAPDVSPLPARRQGYVTYASLSNLVKINAGVLDLWCQVLCKDPRSRFLLYRHILKGNTKERLQKAFEDRGIAHDRVQLLSEVPEKYKHLPFGKRYMGLYEHIDIVLDTFPWNGHTITCENLWMGVPVVTLSGQRHASRIGSSVLTAVGLPDLIARNPDEYIRIATDLAGDLESLEQLRAGLRQTMLNSPLCNGRKFTEDLEARYREIWQRWCRRQTASNTLS